jgi:atypical dual specificity phosphatase
MERFYWLIDGRLAGCSRPGGRQSTDPDVETDLRSLREKGISAVLSLTEEPLPPAPLERAGLASLHLPVPDMHALTADELMTALQFIDGHLHSGGAVAVHCLMGQGRTASVLGAYLIRGGEDAEEAIRELRDICPGALASDAQVHALRRFAGDRCWIL